MIDYQLLEVLWGIPRIERTEDADQKYVSALCMKCVDLAKPDETAVDTILDFLSQKPLRQRFTASDILSLIREAEQLTERGGGVIFANFRTQNVPTEDGKSKVINVSLSMAEILEQWKEITGSWPRRMDSIPFVDDPEHGLSVFHKHTTASVMGYIRSRVKQVKWNFGGSFVSESQFCAEIERTAQNYSTIELLPHEPAIDGIYYACGTPEPGDGRHLEQLLDFYNPATAIDRQLIKAKLLTDFWGGPPGTRPMFVFTSDDGRGVGKTKAAETTGNVAGGVLSLSATDSIAEIKKRLLSPVGQTIRNAVIDNVKTMKFSWAELEALVTAQTISGHRMYTGEGQRPNTLTYVITLNGVNLSEDMAQRCVIIKLVRGDYSGTWYEDVTRFINEHRQEIVADIIGALQAEPQPLEQFTRWGTWEEHVLTRIENPEAAQRLILERQGEANCDREEANLIEDYFAERLEAYGYEPSTIQIGIAVSVVAEWFNAATNERTKTAVATRRLKQMATEGQIGRLSPDASRKHGRRFIWTGENADVDNPILNFEPNQYGVEAA